MAKWRATATVAWYFEAPDKRTAEARFNCLLATVEPGSHRDAELEEIDEEEYRKEDEA